jgi:endonuclease YncB( thermonuclease family)
LLSHALPTLLALTLAASAPFPPSIHHGDTLTLHGERIRLWGADAPELAQTCGTVPAGALARDALIALVAGRTPICETMDTDRYGRTVARCTVAGVDLSAAMVEAGQAWALTRWAGDAYVPQEREAREAGRGVWGMGCERAEVWRDQN